MTTKTEFSPQTLAEAKEYIRDMFMSDELGTFGQRHWNGADSYHCAACYASKDIMGHADHRSSHTEVEHAPDCTQDALYRWALSD